MEKTALTPQQIQMVKGDGFLWNKGTGCFSGRIITENGLLSHSQMAALAQAAEKYGNGQVALTVRLTAEIQGIAFEDIPAFKEFVERNGMRTGGTGSKVRPVVVCKGTTCSNGLCDTFQLGKTLHDRFYEGYRSVTLPHKFKIALGGCPNNCVKPDLNDIGIVAVQAPIFDAALCKNCKQCAPANRCPVDAIVSTPENTTVDMAQCLDCGACVNLCPFNAIVPDQVEYRVYVGGRWGKKVRMGSLLSRTFTQKEALEMVEKSILLFKKYGQTKERFGETVDRLGLPMVESTLLSGQLLEEKSHILGLDTKGGASC